MGLKQFKTKLISLVMAITLLFGLTATTINAVVQADFLQPNSDDGRFDYVSLGASNTNGYGHLGYLPSAVSEDPLAATKAGLNVYGYKMAPENAYPALIKDALEKSLDDKEVVLHQLAISSMRVEEMRFLLDEEFAGDAYLDWRFYDLPQYPRSGDWFKIAEPGGLDALRAAYQNSVKEAELITIDMGWNNFGVYAFNNIKTILADGDFWMAPEFGLLDGLDEQINYASLKAQAIESLKSSLNSKNEELVGKLDKIADVLVYAALGACYHFDKSLEKIYELNPDVQVVVINIQNLADELVIELEGERLELGDAYGEMIEAVDKYRRSASPYADRFMFALAGDAEGDVDTFLDEIVSWNGDPITLSRDMKDCFDMYDDSLYVRSIVEYLMIGQALSQVFAGFRDMGAGYGLNVFKNDSKYTYEFALTRTTEQLLSLNLGALDLNNPAGADADVEAYGQAVSKHLYNLRHFNEGGNNAYNYIFEDLINNLTAQKSQVEALKADGEAALAAGKAELEAGKAQLEQAKSERAALQAQYEAATDDVTKATLMAYIEQYNAGIAENEAKIAAGEAEIVAGEAELAKAVAGITQLEQAINVIVPTAQAQFAAMLEGIYNTYQNTLNYAYDVVATFIQYVASINVLEMGADSLAGFNNAANNLLGILFNDFVNGSMAKFNYELYANGLSTLPNGKTLKDFEVPEYELDESIFDDPALCAIAVLAVRYELGNSFFAHPSVNGNHQVAYAVLAAYEAGVSAKEAYFNQDSEELLRAFYNFLKSSDIMNTPAKIDLLEKLVELLEGEGVLADLPEVKLAKKIYDYLCNSNYLEDEQTLGIILYVYELFLNDRMIDDAEVTDIAAYVYDELLLNEGLTDTDRIAIVGNIYSILQSDGNLPAPEENWMVDAAEGIYDALVEKDYLTDEQTFAIVNFVFYAFVDAELNMDNIDFREIAIFIYDTLLHYAPSDIETDGESLSSEERFDLIMTVYAEIKESNTEAFEEYPQIEVIEALVKDLTEGDDPLISPEQTMTIIDAAFDKLVREKLAPEIAAEQIADVIFEEVFSNEEVETEKKFEIIETIVAALGNLDNSGNDGAVGEETEYDLVTQYMTITKVIVSKLQKENLITDKSAIKLFKVIYDIVIKVALKGEAVDTSAVAKDVFAILFNDPELDLTLKQKIRVANIICLAGLEYMADRFYDTITDEDNEYTKEAIDTLAKCGKYLGGKLDALLTKGLKLVFNVVYSSRDYIVDKLEEGLANIFEKLRTQP